ncbi:uncharacterized protein LOC134530834 isoform X1 [Bacillus rossius redtenbacheri]|uniref:uncharacterized protein LOC134530834 isoform X1 n=1 Tax=Bacillus rossius redtenbacheri TaxID=93214 RepID=UPI002FDDE935
MKEIFSTPEDELFKAQKFLAPRGKLYRKEDLETARNFFENDDISWKTSGKRDCITVKNEVTGKKEKKQKRFLTMSVVEAHQKFSELYPEIHISRSKFFEMRPKHVKPIKDTPHNVCVCIKHANFRFLAEAISPFCIGYQGNSLTPTSLIQIMCCNTHEERCMTNKCSVCHYDVKSLLEPHSDFSREVKWNKWIKTEGQLVVEKVSSSLQNLVTQLNTYIPNFKKHVFVKCEQARYFEDKKNNLRKGEAVMQVDFAENYSIISQVTIFTCCLWFEDMAFSYVVVSDDVSHSKQSAWTFIKTIISHFQQNPNVSLCDLIIFSDNCSSQFKSKYTVFNMCFLADDLNVKTVEWNFFAAGHGKGAVDAIGGQVKRMVWTTVKARRTTVNNAGEFFNVAQAQCKSTEVLYVSKEEIEETSVFLNNRWEKVRGTTGIREIHYFRKIDDLHVAAGFTSTSAKSKVQVAFRGKAAMTNQKCRWSDVYSSDTDNSVAESKFEDFEQSCEDNTTELFHSSNTDDNHRPIKIANITAGMYVKVCITGHGKSKASHHYFAICQSALNVNGDLRVLFLKQYGKSGKLFVPDEDDERDVHVNQVVCTIPIPDIKEIGSRVVYKFKDKVCL